MKKRIFQEGAISLSAAARAFPVIDGKTPTPCTILRWCRSGIDGIRLEHAVFGGRLVTSRQAVERFLEAITSSRAETQHIGSSPHRSSSAHCAKTVAKRRSTIRMRPR